jgi:hypothetical protein
MLDASRYETFPPNELINRNIVKKSRTAEASPWPGAAVAGYVETGEMQKTSIQNLK